MAISGPKPKPLAVKIANGTAPANSATQPNPQRARPKMPSHFRGKKRLRDTWNSLCDTLDSAGILTIADGRVVELCAVAYDDMMSARADMLEVGRTVKGRQSTIIKNPLNCEYHKSADRYFKLLVECGLTPSARTRVHTIPHDEPDILQEFIELVHGPRN